MNINIYKTSNYHLAVFLCTKGFKITDIFNGSKRKSFVFEDSPELQDLVRVFYFGENDDSKLMVNAREIFGNLREVKSKLYNSIIIRKENQVK